MNGFCVFSIQINWINQDLVIPENLPIIQQSSIPVVAYTVRSYEDMTKALDAGITQMLVSDIIQAKEYIQQYFTDQ